MNLRPYQIRTLDEVWTALQVQLNVLMVAPCSAGKTILFSKIIQRLLRENPNFRALILVDREILVSQSADKLARVAPELSLSIGIVCASVSANKTMHKPVTVASRQSLAGKMEEFPPVQLVIIDECHLMAYPTEETAIPDQFAEILCKLREYNPKTRMIGCTASPYRLGGGYIFGDRNKYGLLPYWDHIDSQITTRELLDGNYIAPLVGRVSINDAVAADLGNVGMVAGEFNISHLSDMMCKVVHIRSCVEAWERYATDRKKTLIFCVSIEHAEKVAEAFGENNIGAVPIHSKLSPVDLTCRMAMLENGQAKVFTSVAKLTTGMDVSDIDCIVLARPTESTALYQQIIGRGQRIAPGKTDCLVIDLVGAIHKFGSDMDALWVKIPSSSGSGEAPTKICPGFLEDNIACAQELHASLRYCHHCGYEFPIADVRDGSGGEMKKVLFNAPEPIEEWDVNDVIYSVHYNSKKNTELIKVLYVCGEVAQLFTEYICLPDYYEGYAISKARTWWEEHSDEDFPETCEEFMFLSESLKTPSKIRVQLQDKYYRVIECEFDKKEHESYVDAALPLLRYDDVPF